MMKGKFNGDLVLLEMNQEPQRADHALSFCLFDGPTLEEEKHIAPIRKYLARRQAGDDGFQDDVLFFIEKDMDVSRFNWEIPHDVPGVRTYEVSGWSGWYRHFYRYLPVSNHDTFHYDYIRFTGIDSPRQEWLEQLRPTMETFCLPLACLLRGNVPLDSFISGSCIIRHDLFESLWMEIQEAIRLEPFKNSFQCDEAFLTDWIMRAKIPIVAWSHGPMVNCQVQKWILRRFNYGPALVVASTQGERSVFKDGRNLLKDL